MALKVFVFHQADAPENLQQQYQYYCPSGPFPVSKLEIAKTSTDFTTDERQQIKDWLANNVKCQNEAQKINYLASQRQKQASQNLAFILVGLPLYLYHWRLIKKETKNNLVVNS